MKLVKIFGVVMGVHAAVFVCIFAVPGCRSTGKKPASLAPAVGDATGSPVAASDVNSPVGTPTEVPAADVAAVRFSPTRPGSPVALDATVPVIAAPVTYTVAKGDSLWTIAKKNGVTVKQLTSANNLLTDSRLNLGQKLIIPSKAAVPASAPANASVKSVVQASAAPSAAPAAATVHVVKSGESLGSIAKKYQVRIGDIATANNIADPTKIRVGQSLKIPGTHSSSTKSVSSTSMPVINTVKPTIKPVVSGPAPSTVTAPAPAASPVFTSPLLESAPVAAPSAAESPLVAPTTSAIEAPVISVEEADSAKAK